MCCFLTRSIYQLTMLAVPHLIETKGTVVNISSVNGMRSVSALVNRQVHMYWGIRFCNVLVHYL